MMCEIDGSKDLRIEEKILLQSWYTKKIQDEEGLHNSQARLRNKSGFLKYNYSLIGNTVQ